MPAARGESGGRVVPDRGVQLVVASGKFEVQASVAATPKSLIDSAKPIASVDQMAGARIGMTKPQGLGPARAVHPGRRPRTPAQD